MMITFKQVGLFVAVIFLVYVVDLGCAERKNVDISQLLMSERKPQRCGYGYVYYCETGKCLPEKRHGEHCHFDVQCVGQNQECDANNKTCVCRTRSWYFTNMDVCLPEKSHGESCYYHGQCVGQNQECSILTHTCACISPYHYYNKEDVCLPAGTSVGCCSVISTNVNDAVIYEFERGPWELVILCAAVTNAGDVIRVRPENCDSHTCTHAIISEATTFPWKIPMNQFRFVFDSDSSSTVTFFATNNAENSCTCGSTCASGWTKFGDNCYKRISDTRNFEDQDAHCLTLNERARLISIHSYEEMQFVKNNLVSGSISSDGLWTGLHDVNLGTTPRQWRWTDCSAFDYQNWHPLEPNFNGDQNCAEMNKNEDFHFNDNECTDDYEAICKYYLPPIPPTDATILSCCSVVKSPYETQPRWYRYSPGVTSITILCARSRTGEPIKMRRYPCSAAGCVMAELDKNTVFPKTITANLDADFTVYADGSEFSVEFLVAKHDGSSCSCPDTCPGTWTQDGDHCYALTDSPDTFYNSEDACHSLHPGAHLASIVSQQEHDLIQTTFSSSASEYWIGLHDDTHGSGREQRNWRWTDCTAFGFDNWNPSEPNDANDEEDCAQAHTDAGFKWVDSACDKSIKAVCKYYLAHIE